MRNGKMSADKAPEPPENFPAFHRTSTSSGCSRLMSAEATHGSMAESSLFAASPRAELLKPPRRKACNECKQQKLRCDLATNIHDICSRCSKLGLECKVEPNFKRSRKRRRSFELENEIQDLRRQLQMQASNNMATASAIPPDFDAGTSRNASIASHAAGPTELLSPDHHGGRTASLSGASATGHTITASEASSRLAGLTTKPIIDRSPTATRRTTHATPRPRVLENIELSPYEAEQLFAIFAQHYHPYLPFLSPSTTTTSPHECYEQSELLFWAIVSVAARRMHHHHHHPTLLTLGRAVPDLLWKTTLRSVPYSPRAVQALVLLCAWPFPVSSSTADPTYVLVGVTVQAGLQMGLHRAGGRGGADDFNKVPLRLAVEERDEWVRTWMACCIVAQSVSLGCGLPTGMQMQMQQDWSVESMVSSSPARAALGIHLRIEQFRYRVSQALGSEEAAPGRRSGSSTAHGRERLALYRLLNETMTDLERQIPETQPISRFYASAARFHLHAFYLFDDSTLTGYTERILALHGSACAVIEEALALDEDDEAAPGRANPGFLRFCPFFCYQVFVAAAFVILRLSTNEYFKTMLDEGACRRLVSLSISALRTMSVANNDLPARLGDVISFFVSLPPRGGQAASSSSRDEAFETLRLRVRNRLSMSIVYDSLWEWRNCFRSLEERDEERVDIQDDPHSFTDAPTEFNFDQLDSLIDGLDFDNFSSQFL